MQLKEVNIQFRRTNLVQMCILSFQKLSVSTFRLNIYNLKSFFWNKFGKYFSHILIFGREKEKENIAGVNNIYLQNNASKLMIRFNQRNLQYWFLWRLPKTELTVANKKCIKKIYKVNIAELCHVMNLKPLMKHFLMYFCIYLFKIHSCHEKQRVIKNALKITV